MLTIYKFQLDITDRQVLSMPADADILAVQMQQGVLMLWAKLDTSHTEGERAIRIFGTGHLIPGLLPLRYLGTVQDDMHFVWHVFEEV